MINFNMENAQLPLFYQDFLKGKLGYNTSYYINNGWTCYNFNSASSILDLQIGKKYYTILEHNCIAFKVKSFSFVNSLNIFVEVVFANGETKYYFSESAFFKTIFLSIEDYNNYQITHNENYLFRDKIAKTDLFNKYILKGIFYKPQSNIMGVDIPLYELDEFNQPKLSNAKFKYLWIDKDGLHYSVFECVNNVKYYLTEEECRKSSKIIDFDDDETPGEDIVITLSISIKGSKIKDAVDCITSLGGFVK